MTGKMESISKCIRKAAPPQLTRAWLFGSFAKNRAGRSSDIDVLIEDAPTMSLLDVAGFKISLEDKLGRRVDVVSRRSLHPVLKNEIEATKVLVYEKR